MTKPTLSGDRDGVHVAKLLIAEHGDLAAGFARRNAERLTNADDVGGGASWRRIALIVEMLLCTQSAGTLH